ncbi:hypothetical protein ACFXPZ_05235, partial [Streptomyces sp. NPDC059101]|uniref:hypothetical protein n=1 Tax=Streptomyces sp. NPDC059101 TaxID=3346728 RepID=UPI0036881D06
PPLRPARRHRPPHPARRHAPLLAPPPPRPRAPPRLRAALRALDGEPGLGVDELSSASVDQLYAFVDRELGDA